MNKYSAQASFFLKVILILGIIVSAKFLYTPHTNANHRGLHQGAIEPPTTSNSVDGDNTLIPLQDFLKKNSGAHQCKVTQRVQNQVISGTFFISKLNSKKDRYIYGIMQSTMQGQIMQSMFIIKDGFTYSWNSVAPQSGIKIKNGTDIDATASLAKAGILDYTCEDWVEDIEVFTPPPMTKFVQVSYP